MCISLDYGKDLFNGSDLFGFTLRVGHVEARTWHTAKGAGYRLVVNGPQFATYYAARYATNMGDAMRRAKVWAEREAGRAST